MRAERRLYKKQSAVAKNNQTNLHSLSLSLHRFLIYLLGKNIEPQSYTEVIEDFSAKIPDRQKNGKAALKSDHTINA